MLVSNKAQLRQVSVDDIGTDIFAYVLNVRLPFVWINNIGGMDNDYDIIIPSSNPPVGRWAALKTIPISHEHSWGQIDKQDSALSDLSERSATDLDRGTLDSERLAEDVVRVSNRPGLTVLAISQNGTIVPIKINKDYIAVDAEIPWDRIDFSGITAAELGVEHILGFDDESFSREQNFIKLNAATPTQLGGVRVGDALSVDKNGKMSVVLGTGPNEALEGNTEFAGDLEGQHTSAIVSKIRTIPVVFNANQIADKDKYVLTLNVSNPNVPFFYLAQPKDASNINNDILSFYPIVPNVEVGRTIEAPSFLASFDGIPDQLDLSDSSYGSMVNVRPESITSLNTFRLMAAGSVVFTLDARFVDEDKHKTASIHWLYKIYSGTLPSWTTVDDLHGTLSDTFKGEYDILDGDYIYFAIPSVMGTPRFSVNGLIGGFFLERTINFNNQYGATINYNIWRSDNPNLGRILVELL